MVRAFSPQPLDAEIIEGLIDLARRAPAAGNTDGRDYLLLDTPDAVDAYWDLTLPDERRESFRWQGLLRAPVLIVALVSPDHWVERYAEPDKAGTALGADADAWPVPYWWVDGGMAVMTILHAAVDAGLGGLFFGLFDNEHAVLDHFGVPEGVRALGTVALGWPEEDEPGRSARRGRRPLDEVLHRGHW